MKTPTNEHSITENTRVKLSLKALAAIILTVVGTVAWFLRLESRIDHATDIKDWMRSLSERVRELERR